MTPKVTQALLLPSPRLNLLFVMQQVSANPKITQAELAHKCSLSVAMVNNYMQELCARGFVDYQRKSSRSITYHLTESGKAAVAATGQEYLQTVITLLAETKDKIRQIVHQQGGGNLSRAFLYGTGDLAELVFHALESMGISVIGVCSESEEHSSGEWCGRELLNPAQIRYLGPDVVVIADLLRTEEICRSLQSLSKRGIGLVRLDGREQQKTAVDPKANIGREDLAKNDFQELMDNP